MSLAIEAAIASPIGKPELSRKIRVFRSSAQAQQLRACDESTTVTEADSIRSEMQSR
jgi:hypothetical protein